MLKLIRYLFYLTVLLAVGVVAYAYLGDISVPKRNVEILLDVPLQ